MGADDDVDGAAVQALLHLGKLLGPDEARGLRDLHRQPAEALGEGVEVLAREQRGRHHHGDLLAGEHRKQACAQGHLGLAEADIAADQPVHGAAAREIVEHGVDARRSGPRSPRKESARRTHRRRPSGGVITGA